jgi:hypothetical protein
LRHDPSERFKSRKSTIGALENDSDDDLTDDEISEEEQISDDEPDFDFDINDVVLPNFKISITDFYKKRSQNLSSLTEGLNINDEGEEEEEETEEDRKREKLEGDEARKKREELDELLARKAEELRIHSEILALSKALSDAKSAGVDVPAEDIENLHQKLGDLGVEDPSKLTIDYIIEIESKKDKVYEDYKKLLIDKSKNEENNNDAIEDEKVGHDQIWQSPTRVNKEFLRVSKAITLGNFFAKAKEASKKVKDVDSYVIYLDTSPDSLNALQYTIGSVVKSGDVLYVVNSVDNEDSIEYFKKQCIKLTQLVTTYLELIDTMEEFTLHVVLETAHHKYPKHLVNELIKVLKPNLFIVGHRILLNELSNYMTDIPILVIKKKVRRRSVGGYTRP